MTEPVRVLLIEDSIPDAELVRALLHDPARSHYEITECALLREALELGIKQEEPFDVILLDLGLPDASGLDALERSTQAFPESPIVVLTGLDDDEVAVEAVRRGAQDYIPKADIGQETLARAIRYSIERKTVEKRQTRLLYSVIESLSAASALRDPYTANHQLRVASLAIAIAEDMELDHDDLEGIRIAGLLHDIGKLAIPAELLAKPTKLTALEMEIIQSHVVAARDILQNVDFSWPVLDVILQHHERLDGSGYPYGLSGDQLRLEGRILAVADVVEAMSSHRPYRPALGIEAALSEIEEHAGTALDSRVVEVCVNLLRDERFGFQIG